MHALIILAVLAGTVAATSGCAVPMVSYRLYPATQTEPDLEGDSKFSLASSIVVAKTETDEKTNFATLVFTSAPTEEPGGDTYAIVSENYPWIRLNLGVETFQNTRLIKSVSTNLEDKRVEFINDAAKTITALIGFVASAEAGKAPEGFQGSIDFARLFAAISQKGQIVLSKDEIRKYLGSEKFGEPEATIEAIMIAPATGDVTHKATYPYTKRQRTLIASACRHATIRLTLAGRMYSGTVAVADPNFLQTVALPVSGTVEMHSACGLSVKAGKATVTSDLQVVQTLIQQAKTIRDAQNSKDKK